VEDRPTPEMNINAWAARAYLDRFGIDVNDPEIVYRLRKYRWRLYEDWLEGLILAGFSQHGWLRTFVVKEPV